MKKTEPQSKPKVIQNPFNWCGSSVSLPLSKWGLCSPLGKYSLKKNLPFGLTLVGFIQTVEFQDLSLLVHFCPVCRGRGPWGKWQNGRGWFLNILGTAISCSFSLLRSFTFIFFTSHFPSAEFLSALPFPTLVNPWASSDSPSSETSPQ